MSIRVSPSPRSSPILSQPLSPYFLSSSQPQKIPKTQQKPAKKPQQTSIPKTPAKFSSNKQIRSKSGKSVVNPKEIDATGRKLAQQIKEYGQKLLKKLHVHTMLYKIEHVNKCIKHDCYLSAFDANKNSLLCAVCYTDMKSKTHSTASLSPTKSTKSLVTKPNILPLEKAHQILQTQTLATKFSIQNELVVMKQIEDILYQGFEEQREQLNTKLKIIDDKYNQAINKLKNLQISVKQNILKKYLEERSKHEAVIKELGILRSLVQDYLQPKEQQTKINSTGLFSNLSNQLYVTTVRNSRLEKSPSMRSHSPSPNPSINKLPTPRNNLKILQPPPLKQTIYKHLIYNELSQSLKFGKSGFMWSKQKHRNSIKQLTDTIITEIDKIGKSIPTTLYHKNL